MNQFFSSSCRFMKMNETKVWTRKSELTQGNFLGSLTQPEIIRQGPFELTDIVYDLIK